jgi:hypothetical protein
LGRILAEEHANIFVYERRVVIGSHDHACFKAQRCIRKQLYDHPVRMNASRDRLRKDVSSRSRRVRPLRCEPKSVDSGTASEGDLLGIKSRTPSAGGAGGNRGLWYTLIGLFRILSTRSFGKDCVPWPAKEAGWRRSSRPAPTWRGDVLDVQPSPKPA